MTGVLLYSLVAVFLISLIAFVGILTLVLKKKFLDKILILLIAFAAGSLLGAAFFDLIPESFEVIGNLYWVAVGVVGFFIIESLLHWHHHSDECKKCLKPVVPLNLIADGFHNFIDGVLVVAGFMTGIGSGIAIATAIALHEIPQELGDFAILVNGGLSKAKAIMFNFFSALMAVLGCVVGYLFLTRVETFIPYVIAIAAGGFIYIAGADLIPELHKENHYPKIILKILFLVLGVGLMWFVGH